jgi:hypothetical protein
MAKRFGNVEFEETLGSTALIETLVRMGRSPADADEEFVVVKPGGEITQDMFMRSGEQAPQPMGRGEKAA